MEAYYWVYVKNTPCSKYFRNLSLFFQALCAQPQTVHALSLLVRSDAMMMLAAISAWVSIFVANQRTSQGVGFSEGD
jgi:hypothetical protein